VAATVVDATIVERRELSPLCFLLRLECEEVARRARPGQFVMVRWPEYWPALLSRPLSVVDVDGTEEGPKTFELLIRSRRAGTRALVLLEPGDVLRVTGPLGFGFTAVREATAHVFVAGGVGAAPFPLLARWMVKERPAAPQTMYYLVGGPRSDRLFFTERMAERGATVLTATEDGSSGVKGTVTDLFPLVEEEHGGTEGLALYVAGPPGLLKACAEYANERGLPCELSLESRMGCGMGLCQGCVIKARDREGGGWHYRRVCYEGPVMWAHEVIFE